MKYTNNSIGYNDQHSLPYEDVVTIGAVSHEIAVNKDSATTQHNYNIPEGANVTGISLKGRLITSVGYTSQGSPFQIEKFKTPVRKTIYSYDGIPSRHIRVEYVIDNALLTISITSSIEGGNDTGTALKTSMAVVEATVYYTIAANDINFTSTSISITKPVSFGGDVSIGGSLTIPSDKGLEVGELTGSNINIGSVKGGGINISAIQGGTININAITGGSLKYTVSAIGEAATILQEGCLYYVPTQTLAYGNTTIPGFILYYNGEPWDASTTFYSKSDSVSTTKYYLSVHGKDLTVKVVYDAGGYGGNTSYQPGIKYYKLPITITLK